jgi:hypothetical protein
LNREARSLGKDVNRVKTHKLSDNQLRLVITELLNEQAVFTIAEAEGRFRKNFPSEAEQLDTSEGHSLHETIGGRIYDYSKWGAAKRFKYNPTPPKIERAGASAWKAVSD